MTKNISVTYYHNKCRYSISVEVDGQNILIRHWGRDGKTPRPEIYQGDWMESLAEKVESLRLNLPLSDKFITKEQMWEFLKSGEIPTLFRR